MKSLTPAGIGELAQKLKLLMLFRLIFTSILFGSTIILQLNESVSLLAKPLLVLYALILGIFMISIIYALFLNRIRPHLTAFAYVQIGIDTLVVTLIVFVTGSFGSFFSFLYLVVVIYSSMLLYRRGSMVMALFCSLQYALMIVLEFYGILYPMGVDSSFIVLNYDWTRVFYKVVFTSAACFAVAFLSGLLAEQARRTKKELQEMEVHVKLVEKMATMGELAAGLAHEIKNPLASLAGSIQILRDEIDCSPESDKLMRIVLRETDRLTSLVSDFLMFAKPPAGRVETVRLDQAIQEILELFEMDSTCHERVRVQRRLLPGFWVAIDPTHLRQILWNLLVNAAEAIEGPGDITVTMAAARNRRVRISVQDTGKGIPEAHLNKLFNPFFTTKNTGTGLGLSIVHRILGHYGSRLEVDATAATGTVFHFQLQRTAGDAERPPSNS